MKVPDDAKEIFKGEVFNVYHWEQENKDGSTTTQEMLRRPDTVQIIATEKNKVLFAKQKQPRTKVFFSPFGGRVEKDEDPLETAKRELLEESGYESDDWELLKKREPYSNKMEWTIYTYIARNCKKVAPQNLEPEEDIEVVSLRFKKFVDLMFDEEAFHGNSVRYEFLKAKAFGTLRDLKKKIFKG